MFQTRFALYKGMLQIFPTAVRGEHLVKAGSATGIVVGTELFVYPANMTPGLNPVAQLVVTRVGSTSAILTTREPRGTIEIPTEAYARVTRINDSSSGVRVLVLDRPHFDLVWAEVFSNFDLLPFAVI